MRRQVVPRGLWAALFFMTYPFGGPSQRQFSFYLLNSKVKLYFSILVALLSFVF